MQINVVNHPLLQAKMTILRDKDTKSVTFRHIISEVAALLTFETTRDLPVEEVKVTTPLCETTGCRIKAVSLLCLSCVQAWALWRAYSVLFPKPMLVISA